MTTLLKKHWITSLLCVIILILCFMNTNSLPQVEMTDFDKLVHFIMFLGVSGTVFFENSNYFRRAISFKQIFGGSFLFPTLFSGLIELMQEYFSPYRTGDWMDFLFDGAGAFVGIIICWGINKKL